MVIPTGGGKSALMAWIIQRWKQETPWMRAIILAHRKELVEQNCLELQKLFPGGQVGIFSAGLKRKDYDADILFASIDSVYKKCGEFTPFDVIFVDEAHRIPPKGEGKYRTFINESKKYNPNVKVIGWTATPWRMGCGKICHKDHILNEICYEARVENLIYDGYLCMLRSKVGKIKPELKDVRRNHGGDYIISSLSEATNRKDIVSEAVEEAVSIIKQTGRKSSIFFCVDIQHAYNVSSELRRHGVYAPVITGKTNHNERSFVARRFRNNEISAVCNVNVFTEGFNATCVDCIVLLRPTLSACLYSQMVGRGLRLHSNKPDCLVLDFAGCIDEHGPIDALGGKPVVMAVCGACRESFSRAIGKCPACGWEIPPKELQRLDEAEAERERRMHGNKPSKKAILSAMPATYKVDDVFISRHVKDGSRDSIRIQYRCGMMFFNEWVCLDHDGYAGIRAQNWWRKRMGQTKQQVTVKMALENFLFPQALAEWTKTVTVKKAGKFFEILAYNRPLDETEGTNGT